VLCHNKETNMVKQAIRKWVRSHGIYTASVSLPSSTTVHKTWTKSGALAWLWLHGRKDAVARQQFSTVTNLFGQRIAVRYYR
jgi:hypothetical protein